MQCGLSSSHRCGLADIELESQLNEGTALREDDTVRVVHTSHISRFSIEDRAKVGFCIEEIRYRCCGDKEIPHIPTNVE